MIPPSAAVVVCAYTERRWIDLCAALESVRSQRPAPGSVVLVVDHEEALAVRARAAFEDVVVLANDRRPGLSGARNTAVAHLGRSVEVIVFLDDDAVARPGWLAGLLAPYADPRVMGVGGPALPRWPGTGAPAVLPRELWWVVGCTFTGQYPEGAGSPTAIRNLMGCSMSVRTEAFARVGGFAEDMGRIGTVPMGGEETDLCIRVRQRVPGAEFVLAPDAVVDHRVTPDRATVGYLRRRAYAEGLTKAALARRVGPADGMATERAYTRTVLPAGVVRELAAAGRALRRGRPWDEAADRLRAAGAIPLAWGAAGVGYARGRIARGGHRVGPSVEAAPASPWS